MIHIPVVGTVESLQRAPGPVQGAARAIVGCAPSQESGSGLGRIAASQQGPTGLPSLKLTVRPWKWMVGTLAPENRPGPKRKQSYSNHPLRTVSFRECSCNPSTPRWSKTRVWWFLNKNKSRNGCGNFLRLRFVGGVTLDNFPVKMTSYAMSDRYHRRQFE